MKRWYAEYKGNQIEVENRWSGESLRINGALQDERPGLKTESRLYGKLPDGEEVKVSIGSTFFMECRIFVNNTLIACK